MMLIASLKMEFLTMCLNIGIMSNFGKMMSPSKVKMPSELENALTNSFGSIEKFKEEFCNAGATQFGSGWCWLVKDKDGNLKVTKTENGVNPSLFWTNSIIRM